MAYNDFSFRKYRSYRKNRRRYEVSANVLPCLMVFLTCIPLFDFIKWLMVGVLILFGVYIVWELFKKRNQELVVKVAEEEHARENQIVKEKLGMGTTEKGYVNKNNQKNLGRTDEAGTDHMQWFYNMECGNCGHTYKANGSDIWQRKCPKCQGGRAYAFVFDSKNVV